MAVRLRLKRMGRKKSPFYRLVAIDSRKRRDGLEIERLGWYNPIPKDMSYNFKEDRVLHWLNSGAQASETVNGLFRRTGMNYKWHLTKQGIDESKIEQLLKEWHEREEDRQKAKLEKSKIKKLKASEAAAEETPAEEAPAEAAAEETPAEEAPAEAAAEETPAEEAENKNLDDKESKEG